MRFTVALVLLLQPADGLLLSAEIPVISTISDIRRYKVQGL
jgi:hypothetical protein